MRNISVREFETMTRNRGMLPIAREKIMGMDVFVADGMSTKKDVYVTWFGVGATPDKLDIAQILEFPKYEEVNGLQIQSKREWRKKKALEEARNLVPRIRKKVHGQ